MTNIHKTNYAQEKINTEEERNWKIQPSKAKLCHYETVIKNEIEFIQKGKKKHDIRI